MPPGGRSLQCGRRSPAEDGGSAQAGGAVLTPRSLGPGMRVPAVIPELPCSKQRAPRCGRISRPTPLRGETLCASLVHPRSLTSAPCALPPSCPPGSPLHTAAIGCGGDSPEQNSDRSRSSRWLSGSAGPLRPPSAARPAPPACLSPHPHPHPAAPLRSDALFADPWTLPAASGPLHVLRSACHRTGFSSRQASTWPSLLQYPLPNRLLLSPRSSCGTARSCPSGLGVTGVCGREGGVTGSVSLLCSPPLKAGPQGLRPLRRPRTVLPGFGYPSFEPTCPERPRGAPQAVCSPGPRFPHLQNGGLEQRGLRPNLLMALQGFQGFPNSLACGDRSFAVGLSWPYPAATGVMAMAGVGRLGYWEE